MSITSSVRRAATAGLAAGTLLLGVAGTAAADPAPNCTSADKAGVMSGVGFSLSGYLFTHPDVNAFFTSLASLPKEEIRAKVQDYLVANPQVRDDIKAIRQPATDFRSRCNATDLPAGVPVAPQS